VIPTFAVVGHPNKGKSSIVATLAEDDHVAIGVAPGTTREAHRYAFEIDGETQYVLVDTPGFQRPRAVLDWLEAHATSASERPACVARFVAAHADDPRFHDECALLKPIVDGAGILYVVDGAKPYGPEYEIEMQVLQWTGRPRMALVNLIGPGDHVAEWQQALSQYFSIVRVFDAVRADFGKRVALLRAFAELDETWRPPLERAVEALTAERERRRQRAAHEIASALAECLRHVERAALGEHDDRAAREADLLARLTNHIRRREVEARDRVQAIYRHEALARDEASAELLGGDVFAREGWDLFGLSRTQLAVSGAVSGAIAGGGIDLLLGGASLLLGAGIGSLIGAAGAWFASGELARVTVLGQPLGGRVLQVGPVRDPNFAWVLLGRAWAHHRLVSERNHARREALSLAMAGSAHLMDQLPERLRRDLAATFARIGADSADAALQQRLEELVAATLQVTGSLPGDESARQ
jgi:hypothetical protein